METWALISKKGIKIKEYHVSPDDLVKLEMLVEWLNGFQAAKSGKIMGHFELVMHLRSLVSQYLESNKAE